MSYNASVVKCYNSKSSLVRNWKHKILTKKNALAFSNAGVVCMYIVVNSEVVGLAPGNGVLTEVPKQKKILDIYPFEQPFFDKRQSQRIFLYWKQLLKLRPYRGKFRNFFRRGKFTNGKKGPNLVAVLTFRQSLGFQISMLQYFPKALDLFSFEKYFRRKVRNKKHNNNNYKTQ
jgi:hypothetical protein